MLIPSGGEHTLASLRDLAEQQGLPASSIRVRSMRVFDVPDGLFDQKDKPVKKAAVRKAGAGPLREIDLEDRGL